MIFNDRRKGDGALKAALGKSLAPKRYKPDTAGRAAVHEIADTIKKGSMYAAPSSNRKQAYAKAVKAKETDERMGY